MLGKVRRRENACVPCLHACARAHDSGFGSVCACALSASDLDECIVGTAGSGHMTLTHLGDRYSDRTVADGRLQVSADRM